MKIIKIWLDKEYFLGSGKFDIEENDLGQLRYRNKKAGRDPAWSEWIPRDYKDWNKTFIEFVDNTPPDIDNTEPSDEELKNIDAIKKWIKDNESD